MDVESDKGIASKNYDTYSQVVLGTVVKENTLFIHPSNFNKENILKLLLDYFISSQPESKIGMILSDTESCSNYVNIFSEIYESKTSISVISSSDSLEKREASYHDSNVYIITPHLLRNDIFRNFISPKRFSLLIIEDAFLAKGKHAIVKLVEIFFQNNIDTRVLGFTPLSFSKTEELEEVCTNLLITKIEYGVKDQFRERTRKEQIVSVPINKQIYEFVFEINRYIREYQTFLKEQNIAKPLTVRKEFPSFIMHVRSNFDFDQQQVIIRKAIELINFQTLKDLVESSGIKAAIRYLENLQNEYDRTIDEEKIDSLHSRFVRAPIFQEFLKELKRLGQETDHPKFDRIVQLVKEQKEQKNHKKFLVVVNNRCVEINLQNHLKLNNLECKKLPRKKTKEREKTMKQMLDGKIDVLISTKHVDVKVDSVIFFNNPTRYSSFLERIKRSEDVYILLTHRSNEERVYYNFKNREKVAQRILKSQKIKQILVQNQQKIFKKNMNQRMDTRTRAMISVAKALSKGRERIAKKISHEQLKYVQFLANCSIEEAKQIINHIPESNYKKIDKLPLKFFITIFPRDKAHQIYMNIKGRKQLV